jgi:hypothetical protein
MPLHSGLRREASQEFRTEFSCIKCCQQGSAIWSRDESRKSWPVTTTSPVSTSDGFTLRWNNFECSNPHIVCSGCGMVHRELVV